MKMPEKVRHTPIRDDRIKGASIPRIPMDGYLTPRLRERHTDAIGFLHNFADDDQFADEDRR